MTAGKLQATGQRLRERHRNTNVSHLVDSPLGESSRGTLERCSCDGVKLGRGMKCLDKSSTFTWKGLPLYSNGELDWGLSGAAITSRETSWARRLQTIHWSWCVCVCVCTHLILDINIPVQRWDVWTSYMFVSQCVSIFICVCFVYIYPLRACLTALVVMLCVCVCVCVCVCTCMCQHACM